MAREKKPNILFLFTDDQRFDTIRALGNEQIETPNLDALVESGTAFKQAHIMGGTSGAVCMPSRAMLHTGRTLFHIERQGQQIPKDHVTLGEHLRANGYETFGTGKWHNAPPSYARSFSAGAEIFFGGMADHWNVPACRFDPTGRYEQTPMCPDPFASNEVRYRHCDHITAGRHSTDLLAGAAVEFLGRRDAAKPFLLYCAFLAPHDPRTMPREFLDKYDPTRIELPENFLPEHPFDNGDLTGRDEKLEAWPRTPETIRRHMAEYYAMITHADAAVGRIMQVLRGSGEFDRTIVVFAGDNGLAVGRHGLMGKQNLYDHSVRVPLILAGPGVPRGERRDALCYLNDIFPTVCDLTGMDAPRSVEGLSLAATFADGSAVVREELPLAYVDFQRGIRRGHHKLIEYHVAGRRTTQLFDLAADPWEMHSLADDPAHAGELASLRERLVHWRDALDDPSSFWDGCDFG